MKTLKYFLFLITILSAVFLVFACGGGDDDSSGDDDDAGDDADDDDSGDDTQADDTGDDDDIDDDTVQNPLTVTNFSAGECEQKSKAGPEPDPAAEPHDMVELEWQGGVLKVTHYAAILNCCFDLQVDATQSSSTISVKETDVGDPCDCICSQDVSYDIEGAAPGDYHFLLDGLNAEVKTGEILSKLDVTLDEGSNWKWGIPTVDIISVESDPPYTAGTPFNTRVSACYLQDQDNVQINYRVGKGVYPPDGIYFMVYDRRSLDNPVDPDETCVFYYTDVTVDDPGTYYLRANSFLYPEPQGWELYAQTNAVEVN